jgi:hypothetical protein
MEMVRRERKGEWIHAVYCHVERGRKKNEICTVLTCQ